MPQKGINTAPYGLFMRFGFIVITARQAVRERMKVTGITLFFSLLIVSGGAALTHLLSFASAVPIFLLPLLLIAWRFRFGPAIFASLIATLTLDFYFTEPRGSFTVASSQDVAALCSFLAVVVVVSSLSSRLAMKTDRLEKREAAQNALHSLAERTLLLDWRFPIADKLCLAIQECFSLESVCLWNGLEAEFSYAGTLSGEESSHVRASFAAESEADSLDHRQSLRLLHSGIRTIGSLQLSGNLPEASIVGSIATLVALTLERARALNAEVLAQSESTSEQLRTTVLDGLAHSIKTPLTTIALSSAGAAAIGGLNETQVNLLRLVEEQTHYVAGLTDELLRTASLDAKLGVKPRAMDLSELVDNAIRDLDTDTHPVRVIGMEQPILITSDPDLLRTAMTQVLENAFKYSPPDAIVTILVEQVAPSVSILVHNEDSFIAANEIGMIFNRFYRSPTVEHRAPGTGLGLSVAKKTIEALGGRIAVESHTNSGTTFTMEIPIGGETHARLSSYR